MQDKKADLAGPGIGDYNEIERILPKDYNSLLNRKDSFNEKDRMRYSWRL